MKKQDRKWLGWIRDATDAFGGMYPGEPVDRVPQKVGSRLYAAGYVTTFIPHNPVHKERWTITLTGRAALTEN